MKTQTLIIGMIIILSGLVSAQIDISPNDLIINAYPGETHQRNFSISSCENCTITFNSSNPFVTISPKELVIKGNEIILNITFSKNTPLGQISFFINASTEKMVDEKEDTGNNDNGDSHHSSVGGSSCKYNKNYDWKCSDWNECIEGTQIRTCKKYNNCGNTYGKPEETKSCQIKLEPIINNTDPIIVNEPKEEEINFLWLWIIGGLFVLLIIIRVIQKIKQHKNNESEDHTHPKDPV